MNKCSFYSGGLSQTEVLILDGHMMLFRVSTMMKVFFNHQYCYTVTAAIMSREVYKTLCLRDQQSRLEG